MITIKLVSACLCGVNCKYNGKNNLNPVFLELLKMGRLLPVCPEQLGGLPTPRPATEIAGGTGKDIIEGRARVISEEGKDVTSYFLKGAQETLQIALQAEVTGAILQRRSPSCGVDKIYDGTFSQRLINGDGVTAALLKKHGIKVYNDQDFLKGDIN